MNLLKYFKSFIIGNKTVSGTTRTKQGVANQSESRGFGIINNAKTLKLTANGDNKLVLISICRISSSNVDRIIDKMMEEDDFEYLSDFMERPNNSCKNYSILNLWGEDNDETIEFSVYGTSDEILCQGRLDANNMLGESAVTSSLKRFPEYILVRGRSVEDAWIKLNCQQNIDMSKIKFTQGLPYPTLECDFICRDCTQFGVVSYSGAPMKIIKHEAGNIIDEYYAVFQLNFTNGIPQYSLVCETSTELS